MHGSLMGWPVVLGFGVSSGNNMECGKTLGLSIKGRNE